MLEREISEFGRRINIPGLNLDNNGLLMLDIENMGRLCLELSEHRESLYVYLSLPYQSHDTTIARKILQLCSYDHAYSFPIKGGIHDGWALLLTEFDTQKINAATLENTVRTLASILEKIFD